MLRKREVETQSETREGKKETRRTKVGKEMEGSLGRRQGIVQDEPRVKETAPEVNIQK